MANKTLSLKLIISAKDNATKVLNGIGKAISGVTAKVAAFGASVGAYFTGKAVAGFFTSAVTGAADFEEQLNTVAAVTRATTEEMQSLEEAALQAGETTKFTAQEAAVAMEELARAGQSPVEVIESLDAVMGLAQANAIGLGESAGIVSAALAGFNLEASEAGRVADVLTRGAQSAKTTVDQLAAGLSYAAPQANAMGISIETVTALLGKMADAGVDASRGGTALNSMLIQISNPASTASKALDAAGIQTREFVEILAELEKGGPKAEAAILAFGTEAGPGLQALLGGGTQGVRDLIAELEAAGDGLGATADAAATMSQGFNAALTALGSAWDTLKIKLVDPLLAPLEEELRSITVKIREFAKSPAFTQLRDSITKAFDDSLAAVKRFAAGIDFETLIQDITDFVEKSGEKFGSFVSKLDTMSTAAGKAFDTMSVAWNAFKGSVELFGESFSKLISLILEGNAKVASGLAALGLMADDVSERMTRDAEAFADVARQYGDASTRSFAAAGAALDRLTASHDAVAGAADGQTKALGKLDDATKEAGQTADEFDEQLKREADAFDLVAAAAAAQSLAINKNTADTAESVSAHDDVIASAKAHGVAIEDLTAEYPAFASSVDDSGQSLGAIEGQLDATTEAAKDQGEALDELRSKTGEIKTFWELWVESGGIEELYRDGRLTAEEYLQQQDIILERMKELREEGKAAGDDIAAAHTKAAAAAKEHEQAEKELQATQARAVSPTSSVAYDDVYAEYGTDIGRFDQASPGLSPGSSAQQTAAYTAWLQEQGHLDGGGGLGGSSAPASGGLGGTRTIRLEVGGFGGNVTGDSALLDELERQATVSNY